MVEVNSYSCRILNNSLSDENLEIVDLVDETTSKGNRKVRLSENSMAKSNYLGLPLQVLQILL